MESQSDADDEMKAIKKVRRQLESRVETLTNAHIDIIASLQHSVSDLVSSLDLSLKAISAFNGRPFTPLPKPLPNAKPKDVKIPILPLTDGKITSNNLKSPTDSKSDNERFVIDERGGPLSVVRSMVAVCLLERVPFTPIDSSTVLRKLENDQSATAAERAALRELGGESGAILAVEMALRSMAEDNGGVDLEEFVVSGKSRVMVMNIDRTRLLKELPESKQLYQQSEMNADEKNRGIEGAKGGVDVNNSGGFGMGRPMHDMWMQGPGMPPMFPGGMGARMGGPRGMVGMMGVPRGVGVPPPMQRPPMGPNVPMGGTNAISLKPRTEEDDMKDLEALLNKKSFREMQKSKTGEELLDLIHRPTARETAVAAKVHFRRIIAPHTDANLGDCSFLDTCRHMKTCKYVHYELDSTPDVSPMMGPGALAPSKPLKPQRADYCSEVELGEAQWINCDIRNFRMDILGQFGVIMADPPWDIHMELPYGTMADDEMRTLNVPALQTDGLIFLWVTGRAMELGREWYVLL